jgi:hypothetical protein
MMIISRIVRAVLLIALLITSHFPTHERAAAGDCADKTFLLTNAYYNIWQQCRK